MSKYKINSLSGFWKAVAEISENQRKQPLVLRELSSVPSQPFHEENLPPMNKSDSIRVNMNGKAYFIMIQSDENDAYVGVRDVDTGDIVAVSDIVAADVYLEAFKSLWGETKDDANIAHACMLAFLNLRSSVRGQT